MSLRGRYHRDRCVPRYLDLWRTLGLRYWIDVDVALLLGRDRCDMGWTIYMTIHWDDGIDGLVALSGAQVVFGVCCQVSAQPFCRRKRTMVCVA